MIFRKITGWCTVSNRVRVSCWLWPLLKEWTLLVYEKISTLSMKNDYLLYHDFGMILSVILHFCWRFFSVLYIIVENLYTINFAVLKNIIYQKYCPDILLTMLIIKMHNYEFMGFFLLLKKLEQNSITPKIKSYFMKTLHFWSCVL